jgi:hypothetical protein
MTFRLDEILDADYVVFEPIGDHAMREAILQHRTVSDFGAEQWLMKAWFSTLSSAEGVALLRKPVFG